MPSGGRRAGAGRKLGAIAAKSREVADRSVAAGLTPLEYLLSVMRDGANELPVRVDAAKAASRYMHAPIGAVEPRPAKDDHVPLAERIKAYAREDAIKAAEGKVIEMKRSA